MVPYVGGHQSYSLVKATGYPAEWAKFDVAHSMCVEEVHFIGRWLKACFPRPEGRVLGLYALPR